MPDTVHVLQPPGTFDDHRSLRGGLNMYEQDGSRLQESHSSLAEQKFDAIN